MPAAVIPFKAGIVVLLGVVSAPLLAPAWKAAVKTSVRVGDKVKELTSDATFGLKVLAAEAVQEDLAAREGSTA